MAEEVDACIIGGGIVGMYAALELKRNDRKVRLIDQLYKGSSRSNVGDIMLRGNDSEMLPLLQYSYDSWENTSGRVGKDLGFEQPGSAYFAMSDANVTAMANEAEAGEKHLFQCKYVERQALQEDLGITNLHEDIKGGIISTTDGAVNTNKAVDELRRQLIKEGVLIWGNDEVNEFKIKDDTVIGIKTNTGEECTAATTVVCAGIWSNRILQRVGINLSLRPVRRHILKLFPNDAMPDKVMAARDEYGEFIMKYQNDGSVLASYTALHDPAQSTWSREEDPELIAWIRWKLEHMCPAMKFAELRETNVVTTAATPDGRPYIGKPNGLSGLCVAAGFNGLSYAYGAGAGRVVRSIVNGEEPAVDISPFKLDRFGKCFNATKIGSTPEDDDESTPTLEKN